MKGFRFLMLAAFSLAVFQCEKAPITIIDPVPVDSVAEVARMNQVLGWKLFNEEQKAKPGENVLISPYSIQTALFMAHNAAQGLTLEQMLDVAGCPNCAVVDLNGIHRQLNTLLTQQSGHPQLTIANAYFYDANRINVRPPFLQAISGAYDCVAENTNFSAEQAALQLINNWVKNNTNGKIEEILDKITNLDVAFLINALHFKADWATGFDPQTTHTGAFIKADGAQIQVQYVNADRDFSVAQTAGFNLVDIPFRDSTYSISLIQPSLADTDPAWHKSITPESWRQMYEGMSYGRAYVSFPKLKLAYDNDLIQSLVNLGVTAAFDERTADFTPMGTSPTGKNIFIKQIKHKAVLEVDEKGAEGAAVTAIGFGITSAPPAFTFNRPFVLVLRHIPTDAMIFTAFVADPAIP